MKEEERKAEDKGGVGEVREEEERKEKEAEEEGGGGVGER